MMSLAGIRLVRQVFGELLPAGWTVAQAHLDYVHESNAEFQVLTFHVNGPDGKIHMVTSRKVSAKEDINELAIATAKRFLEEDVKHAQAPAPVAPAPEPAVKPEPGDGH